MNPDYYAVLGLSRDCTTDDVRRNYRRLAKRHHPDAHGGAPDAAEKTRELNEAHAILSDPARRRAYDEEASPDAPRREGRVQRNISQDAELRIEDFFRGTRLEIHVKDPCDPETYALEVPPGTAPGARFRISRNGGGAVTVRLRVRPSARFKARGSDLRCDLRIDARRASEGGSESLPGPTGSMLRVQIPPRIGRGEVLRLAGEGLPKARGGRGDLLIRISYRPEIRITRTTR